MTSMRSVLTIGCCASLYLFIATAEAEGADAHAHDALGVVDFPISCAPAAQAPFNRAVALLHHMTYPQARTAFEDVASIDPNCAMAQWGVAMTLFHPLWPTRPTPKDLAEGWDAASKAKALNPPTERERLFVASVEAFFMDPSSTDYWARVRRWEGAMQAAYAKYPDDTETMAFYALALLAAAPPNSTSHENADEAAEVLLRIYARNPEHPGAMHYLVHANDTPGREHESLDITRKYEAVAPNNPHALHMPTHIYTRIGDWQGVIKGNLRAADAALQYPAGAHGEFVWDEFPHAIEYLVYAYLQVGADEHALAQTKRLQSVPNLEPTFKTAFHLASTQARCALERGVWTDAAAIVPREPKSLDWDRYTWPEAIAWFARGFGAAKLSKLDNANAASRRLGELEAVTRTAGEELFARNIHMLLLEQQAAIAAAGGNRENALALLREAAELEASTPKAPVTPAPTLPATELLGDYLMEGGQAELALAAYQRSLEFYPRRFNGVLGAARAAQAAGQAAVAREYYRTLVEIAGDGGRQPAIDEAKRALSEL
jgi:tetratricopeptide (TPR) repeat protein